MQSKDPLSFLPVTLLATCMLGMAAFSPAFAAGVCRDANCAGSAPKEDKCDQAALDEARAAYKKWIGIYREQAGAASDADGYANEATEAALEDAKKFYEPMLEKLQDKPKEIVRDNYIEKFLKMTFSEEVAHAAALGAAVYELADLLIDQANVTAKEITAMQQAEKNAAQAEKAAQAAMDSLKKALSERKRIEALERQCQSKGKAKDRTPESANSDDDEKTSGERDLDAARKILNSWTKVEHGYIDADGAFQTVRTATAKALAIVQGNEEASFDDGYRFVRTGGGDDYLPAAASGAMLSAQQVKKFQTSYGLALTKMAQAWKSLMKVKAELLKIHALRAK
jgi:hypothetical protein